MPKTMTTTKAAEKPPRQVAGKKPAGKAEAKKEPEMKKERDAGILSCSCTAVQSASKAYSVQAGEKKEIGRWNGASGTDCTCGGKKYSAVAIAFPGAPVPEMPAIDAASVIQPFTEARRRFSEIVDEMDRAFLF